MEIIGRDNLNKWERGFKVPPKIKSHYQRLIAGLLGSKLIAYNSDLVKALGSVSAGVLLHQLLYWQDKGKNPEWIYKTIKDIETETGLTRWEQETAIKILKGNKLIEVKLKGVPATRNFKVDLLEVGAFIERYKIGLKAKES